MMGKTPPHLDERYVRRDFAFREGHPLPVPLAEYVCAGAFFLRTPAGTTPPSPLWVITGIWTPVPCVTVTLWYNTRRVFTIAPADASTYRLMLDIHDGLPVRIEQDFGHHGPYSLGTHVLTLVGYFVRDDLLEPPQAALFADAD